MPKATDEHTTPLLPSQRKPSTRPPESPISRLPFVDMAACNFWSVPSTGSYSQDWNVGEAHGREMLAFMRDDRNSRAPQIMGWVAWDMARAGGNQHGNAAVLGFMAVIADAVRAVSAVA